MDLTADQYTIRGEIQMPINGKIVQLNPHAQSKMAA